MNIPIRPSPPVYDVLARPRQALAWREPTSTDKPVVSALAVGAMDAQVGQRDVGGDLDRLFARLLSTSVQRESRARLALPENLPSSASSLTSVAALTANPQTLFSAPGAAAVIAGSFLVNGTEVEVRANDSINAVLQRISDTVPDITASFSQGRVRLAARTHGRQDIVVEDDNSGFLAAVGLRGAVSVPGRAAGGQEVLGRLTTFTGVQAGSFKVGGATVAVDPSRDTLPAVLARISEAAPGVVAFVEGKSGKVVVRGADAQVTFGDDSSGFLAAAGIAAERPAALRERFTLAPGIAERLERGASDQRASLLGRALSGLEWLVMARPAQAPTGAEVAKRAQSAYVRGVRTNERNETSQADTIKRAPGGPMSP